MSGKVPRIFLILFGGNLPTLDAISFPPTFPLLVSLTSQLSPPPLSAPIDCAEPNSVSL